MQKTLWECSECGHTQHKWSGSCTVCKAWNTIEESRAVDPKTVRYSAAPLEKVKPIPITELKESAVRRFTTRVGAFDRVMGGGVVPGSLVLLGGDPGIGKSTLMLQIASYYAKSGQKVLYVCGEESAEQTGARAARIGISHPNIFLLSETNLGSILKYVDELVPDLLVIDSVQIVYKPEINSSPGSVTQVKEVAVECMHVAKGRGITTFLIGHVTKSGDLAGPRVLEHLVDTVLEFEGNHTQGIRLLRTMKNRFGPTDEVGVFQMGAGGLAEVENASKLFLEQRLHSIPGSSVTATVEGSCPFLIEIQALVAKTAYATATRKSTGIDQNRLSLLLAVLEKRLSYSLHTCDVFVSIVGGIKIKEPAIDLAIVGAILSSYQGTPLPPDLCMIGEVGLSGEVRPVPRFESRLKEALQMGFKQMVVPQGNLVSLPKQGIELIGVKLIDQAVDLIPAMR